MNEAAVVGLQVGITIAVLGWAAWRGSEYGRLTVFWITGALAVRAAKNGMYLAANLLALVSVGTAVGMGIVVIRERRRALAEAETLLSRYEDRLRRMCGQLRPKDGEDSDS